MQSGADAVHPGYGYLSENGGFSDAVRAAGLIFIGPSSQAMSTLGDKRAAKEYLSKHAPEVPLIPGFRGASQRVEDLEEAAESIGFPIMLKASAGGGGKGIRVVQKRADLYAALDRAQSEAQRSFGSNDVILEKYVEAAKHVEFQIVGDSHGDVVSLLDRDCSVQRRHQKVIEETPCLWLSDSLREEMSRVAVQVAKVIRYEGAGTVEFVLDVATGKYYFLEVNARLQVEHPITEEVLGLDLVSLQLYVAAGGSLSAISRLSSISQSGHAIECRLCAEDPQRGFLPEQGTIRLWSHPRTSDTNVRFETAIATGARISIHFDSMIAKIIVWAPTRPLAIHTIARILRETACLGVRTNQLFLQSCLLHPAFYDTAYTTSFIPDNLEQLLQNPYNTAITADNPVRPTLALVPFLYLHRLAARSSTTRTTRPFQNIRKGFRNQSIDQACANRIIVSESPSDARAESTDLICTWIPVREEVRDHFKVALMAVAAPETPATNAQPDSTSTMARVLTARYNVISQALRDPYTLQGLQSSVSVLECDTTPAEWQTSISWQTARIEVSLDGHRVLAKLAAMPLDNQQSGPLPGQITRVLCHFPLLGTWVEYKCQSILQYMESLRNISDESAGQSKVVKAPMPCKVISVLKRIGELVKKGETVMVVESMKMEINISMDVEGAFQSTLKQGDAVDDGTILCSVEP